MTLDIDRLLTDDAETWRATIPPSAGPAELVKRQPGRPRRHVVLAVAASVAVVLVAAGVVLGIHWSSSTSNSTLGPHFPGPCQDNFVFGPTEHRPLPPLPSDGLPLTLIYRGSSACHVSAYGPYIELRDARGNLLGTGRDAELLKLEPGYLVVRPGDSLAVTIGWFSGCPAPARVATVILHLAGRADTSGVGVAVTVPANYSQACDRQAHRPLTGFVRPAKLFPAHKT